MGKENKLLKKLQKMNVGKPSEEEKIKNKWKSLGFLDGLKGHVKPEIAKLYECCKSRLLNQKDMKKKILKLSIFDFDGTLINTELPETGKLIWKEKHGQDWPHQGWWGKAESLHIDYFDNDVIDHVIEDYKMECESDITLKVMLTGRRSMLSDEVEKILDKHGLVFDRKYYNTGGDTISCKIKTLDKLLIEFPDVEFIEIWEDRAPHVDIFEKWGETVKPEVKVVFVEPVIKRFF